MERWHPKFRTSDNLAVVYHAVRLLERGAGRTAATIAFSRLDRANQELSIRDSIGESIGETIRKSIGESY